MPDWIPTTPYPYTSIPDSEEALNEAHKFFDKIFWRPFSVNWYKDLTDYLSDTETPWDYTKFTKEELDDIWEDILPDIRSGDLEESYFDIDPTDTNPYESLYETLIENIANIILDTKYTPINFIEIVEKLDSKDFYWEDIIESIGLKNVFRKMVKEYLLDSTIKDNNSETLLHYHIKRMSMDKTDEQDIINLFFIIDSSYSSIVYITTADDNAPLDYAYKYNMDKSLIDMITNMYYFKLKI